MSDESRVELSERTPADVAMKLLEVSTDLDFAVTVCETKEDPPAGGFMVEWSGGRSIYEIIGILQRAIVLLSSPGSYGKEEDSED